MMSDRKNSLTKYLTIFNKANDAIFVHDAKTGKILDINQKVVSLFGYKKDELVGSYVGKISTGKDGYTSENANKVVRKAMRHGPQIFEWHCKKKNGDIVWIEVNLKKVKIDGEFRILAIVRDITKRKEVQEALNQYKFIFEQSSQQIAVADLKGFIIFANQAWATGHGHEKEELSGKHLSIFHPKREMETVNKFNNKLFKKGSNKGTIIHKKRNGDEFTTLMSSFVVNISNKPAYIVGMATDVTQKNEAIEALKKSEEKYRSLFENMQNGFALHKIVRNKKGEPIDYIFLAANETFEKLTGLKIKNIINKRVSEVLPGIKKDPGKWIERYGTVAITGKWIRFNQYYPYPLNKWYSIYAFKPGEDQFATIFEDITEQKRIEKLLEQNEEKFRMVAKTSTDYIYEWDIITNKLDWFGGFERSLGYKKGEIPYTLKAWFDLIHPDDQKKLANSVKLHRTSTKPIHELYRMRHKNGSWKYWLDKGVPVLNKNKKPVKWIGGCLDITNIKKAEDEAKQARDLAEKYLELSSNIIVATDLDGTITLLNKSGHEFLGYKDGELIGKNWLKYCLPNGNHKEMRDLFLNTNIRKRSDRYYRNLIFTKKGEQKWVQWYSRRIRDEQGKVVGIISSGGDLTDRILAENKLEENEKKYRSVVENVSDGIAIVQNSKTVFVNNSLAKMVKLPAKKIINTHFIKHIHESERKRISENYRKRVKNIPLPSTYETLIVNNKKEIVPVEISGRMITYNEKPADLVVIRDISYRKKAESQMLQKIQELKAEKDKIEAIVENIADAVFVIDKSGSLILYNRGAVSMTGYSKKYAIGKKFTNIIALEINKGDKSCGVECIKKVFKTNKRQYITNTRLKNKDGEKIPVSISAAPITKKNDDVSSCVVVMRDMSIEKEIDFMKTEFVSLASHQLRTPISGIKWFLEILLKEKLGPLNNEQIDFLEQININNDRMIKIITDLLNLSRMETGKRFYLNKSKFNLVNTVEKVLKYEGKLIESKNILIKKVKPYPKKLNIYADADKIKLVISNLITNAVKYSHKGAQVEIGFSVRKNYQTTFFVRDSGIGIPLKQRNRVFEKFFRADNAATKETEGSGLGLYIAKGITEAHGGQIWFEPNKRKKGTCFYFTLPLKLSKKNK